jgi:hypothetical protein
METQSIPVASCKNIRPKKLFKLGHQEKPVGSHFWHDAAINGKIFIPCIFKK